MASFALCSRDSMPANATAGMAQPGTGMAQPDTNVSSNQRKQNPAKNNKWQPFDPESVDRDPSHTGNGRGENRETADLAVAGEARGTPPVSTLPNHNRGQLSSNSGNHPEEIPRNMGSTNEASSGIGNVALDRSKLPPHLRDQPPHLLPVNWQKTIGFVAREERDTSSPTTLPDHNRGQQSSNSNNVPKQNPQNMASANEVGSGNIALDRSKLPPHLRGQPVHLLPVKWQKVLGLELPPSPPTTELTRNGHQDSLKPQPTNAKGPNDRHDPSKSPSVVGKGRNGKEEPPKLPSAMPSAVPLAQIQCDWCLLPGHQEIVCSKKARGHPVTCSWCQSYGHKEDVCRKKARGLPRAEPRTKLRAAQPNPDRGPGNQNQNAGPQPSKQPVAPKPVAPKPVAPKPVAPKPVAPKAVAPKPWKKHVWPKNRDMKPQDDDEYDLGDGGGGWSKSNSDGDSQYDVKKLMAWNGGWLPPPLESERSPFVGRHGFKEIDVWFDKVDIAYGNTKEKIRTKSALDYAYIDIKAPPYRLDGLDGEYIHKWTEGGELAPRAWVPTKIGDESAQQFWRSYPQRAPGPKDDLNYDELKTTVPWWETYGDKESCQLPLVVGPDLTLDPEEFDNKNPRLKLGSLQKCDQLKKSWERHCRRLDEKRYRPINSHAAIPTGPDLSLKPKANFFLRPAVSSDMDQITMLYNHYVKNTVSASEFIDRETGHMITRINNIRSRNLPWIVAVLKANKDRANSPFAYDTIVGFACLDDYCDIGSMYRFTVELEMYVHHNHLHQGIGKCMLDKMLSLCHTGYTAKGGYDWLDRGNELINGCKRVVKVITFSFPYLRGETETVTWISKFFKDFGFRIAGHLVGVGFKKGMCADVHLFQITTSETIDAVQGPSDPL